MVCPESPLPPLGGRARPRPRRSGGRSGRRDVPRAAGRAARGRAGRRRAGRAGRCRPPRPARAPRRAPPLRARGALPARDSLCTGTGSTRRRRRRARCWATPCPAECRHAPEASTMRVVTPPEIGERQGYAAALADLWRGLQPTLSNLDSLAATPAEELLDRGGELLPRLQYELHTAGELALGIVAPAGTEGEHADLAAALAAARDATAQLLEAVESGSLEAVAALTYPWRGALFEVRLARLRLGAAARTA